MMQAAFGLFMVIPLLIGFIVLSGTAVGIALLLRKGKERLYSHVSATPPTPEQVANIQRDLAVRQAGKRMSKERHSHFVINQRSVADEVMREAIRHCVYSTWVAEVKVEVPDDTAESGYRLLDGQVEIIEAEYINPGISLVHIIPNSYASGAREISRICTKGIPLLLSPEEYQKRQPRLVEIRTITTRW